MTAKKVPDKLMVIDANIKKNQRINEHKIYI